MLIIVIFIYCIFAPKSIPTIMNLLQKIHINVVRKWILMRMAASEFSYKQPFSIEDEYPIMTSVLGFSFVPIYLIFVFLRARIYGSLERFQFPLIIAMFVLCFGIAYLMIRLIKNAPFIDRTMREYESMELEKRRKIFSYKNLFKLLFIMVVVPWTIAAISIYIICITIPHI